MPSPNPSTSPAVGGRALVQRLFFGVTSIGAALGLLYLYYSYQRRKDSESADTEANSAGSATSKRKKRVASGSSGTGENKNRVTFSDETEVFAITPVGSADSQIGDGPLAITAIAAVNKSDLEEPPVVSNAGVNHITGEQPVASSSPGSRNSVSAEKDQPKVSVVNNEQRSEAVGMVDAAVVKAENDEASAVGDMLNGGEISNEPVVVAKPATVVSSSSAVANGYPFLQTDVRLMNAAITPETDYNTISMVREIRIPRDHVPGLIGKKGSHIRSVQNTSNTQINFKDETLDNGDRVCVIRGIPQNVTIAEAMIEKYILEQPLIMSHKISIPLSSVGRIIGKGGENIRMIQDLSKAKVNVDTGINHYRGGGESAAMRTVLIRGTEEQIETARQMIIAKVDEEQTLRRNIDLATQNRTPRRATNPSTSSSPGMNSYAGGINISATGVNANSVPLKTNGVMEVFVSCAYHPNDFWIQVVGRESVELDKLAEAMTEWYRNIQRNPEEEEYCVGDIVAAPFDVDEKMYRCKILKIDGEDAEVVYVDYGDKRIIKVMDIQRLHPEFLKLRFQAIQATLNLGRTTERWSDEAISVFCDLTHCAQWQSLTAKVKDYLKDPNDQKDIIWIELLDVNFNIGDELIRQELAVPLENVTTAASTGMSMSSNGKKSYAAVVVAKADEQKSSSSMNPSDLQDGHPEETWDDEYNGN